MALAHRLELTAPIDRWDEAIPLGNGLSGGLLWGEDRTVRLSLDRGDLWDERTSPIIGGPDWNWATLRRLVGERKADEISKIYDTPYADAFPTKLPGGRIELDLPEGAACAGFALDLDTAVGSVTLGASRRLEVFFSATEPVTLLRATGCVPVARLVAPGFGKENLAEDKAVFGNGSLGRMGYPAPQTGREGEAFYFRQTCSEGFVYAVSAAWRTTATGWEMAIAMTTNEGGVDPVRQGRDRAAGALARGFEEMLKPHGAWWCDFWARSSVRLPDVDIERHYRLVQYFYGAASRRGAPPIPLQGVWTADEGSLPPWKGDYHNDLNTQLTYWAYPAAGHLEEGLAFLDFMWSLLPRHRQFARDFYGVSAGAAVPGVMSLKGREMGGWVQYSLSPTSGAWVAHPFYLHWRYSMDRRFLAERAYPYLLAMAEFQAAMLEPDAQGKLKLALSSSPEIHDNRLEAFVQPNSNYDQALLRWLFAATAELADEMGKADTAVFWRGKLSQLEEMHVAEPPLDFAMMSSTVRSALLVAPNEAFVESHRHFSHAMAIYPLGLLQVEGSEKERRIVERTLNQLDMLGTQWWCGYSFSWMACMQARCGRGTAALDYLNRYLKGFVSRNGFHLNGDYKNQGFSNFKYRPFTLEGNFAAAQAVHEMLLQSWGGKLRVFPAAPDIWADIEFDGLRAEGALRVSARRRKGRTVFVRIVAECDTIVKLQDPFESQPAQWTGPGLHREGGLYTVELGAGQFVEATVV
jgi:alpha-L-fucosidase 2